jgi:hypothetical protein
MVNVTLAAHKQGTKTKQSQNGSRGEAKEVEETVGETKVDEDWM